MKRITRILGVTVILMSMLSITAFAGIWKYDGRGWWWDYGNGSYPRNQWEWCDGDYDGMAECYCFDQNGYCLMNTRTPDGYQINANGAWVQDGNVVTTYVGIQDDNYYTYANNNNSGVMGGGNSGTRQYYKLAGYQSVVDSSDGVMNGYLILEQNGTGTIKMGDDSPEYYLTYSRSGDELNLNFGFDNHTAYIYEELGQIRMRLGDNVFYFTS